MMKRLIVLCMLLSLSACGAPLPATPAPTPQAITVIYPPDLQPWVDRLGECADNNPLTALFVQQSNQLDPNISPNEIALGLNPSGELIGNNFASQVGQEQVVVVVNRDNPVTQLSTEALRSIYSGQTSVWPTGTGGSIQVWVLPQGDPLREIFDQAVMQGQPLTTQAMLAPDPAAMLEAVSGNLDAIGYLPASFLRSKGSVAAGEVEVIQLDHTLETTLEQPVVALTPTEPAGLIRSLLVCLESNTP